MKIAKIIDIMKSFTSFPLPVQTGDNPALRVILPTLWGASPHVLGKRVGRRGLGPQESAAPSGTPEPGRSRAPTASNTKLQLKKDEYSWHLNGRMTTLGGLQDRFFGYAQNENNCL